MSATAIATLDSSSFDYVCRLVNNHAAVVLEPTKGYLVEARLTPIAKRRGFASIDKLVAQLRKGPFGEAHDEVVEALLIHETSFYRDFRPFEVLKSFVLPELIAARAARRSLSIWSAACSSGQEADTIAMLLLDHFPVLRDWKVSILASDLSERVLDRARRGEYTQLEVNRGLPSNWLVKYFQRDGLRWQVRPEVRRSVRFMKLNLADPWPNLPTMDLILLRNVLIYVASETKLAILAKVRRQLAPDGTLLLGAAEMMNGMNDGWRRVAYDRTSTYRPDGP